MKKETIIGFLFLAIVAGFLITMNSLRKKHYLTKDLIVYAKFKSIANLMPTQPVKVSGQVVGQVVKIFKHDPASEWIILELKIFADTKIPKYAVPYVLDASGVGISVGEVNIEFSGVCEEDCVTSGDTLVGRGKLFSDILSASTLASLDTTLQKLANTDSVFIMIDDMRKTMDNANRALSRMSPQVLGVLASAKSTTGNFEKQNAKVSALLDSLTAMTRGIKDKDFGKTISQAQASITQIGKQIEALPATLVKADGALDKLNTSLDNLMKNAQFAKLANDRTAFDNLHTQIKKIDSLVVDIRINPKKYLKLGKKGKIIEVD